MISKDLPKKSYGPWVQNTGLQLQNQTLLLIANSPNILSGVPSAPGRPVIELSTNRLTLVEENSVTDEISIGWDVPRDDGGYPITGRVYFSYTKGKILAWRSRK